MHSWFMFVSVSSSFHVSHVPNIVVRSEGFTASCAFGHGRPLRSTERFRRRSFSCWCYHVVPISHVRGKVHRVVDILIYLTLQACFAPGLEFKEDPMTWVVWATMRCDVMWMVHLRQPLEKCPGDTCRDLPKRPGFVYFQKQVLCSLRILT